MGKFIEIVNAPIMKKIIINTDFVYSVEEYLGNKMKGKANAVIKMDYNENDIDHESQRLIYTRESYEQIKSMILL